MWNMCRFPQQFDMGSWVGSSEPVQMRSNGCGTTACIAGHLVLASHLRIIASALVSGRQARRKLKLDVSSSPINVKELAARILGFPPGSVETECLFHWSMWPQPFRAQYAALLFAAACVDKSERRQALRKRTAIAIRRFRHFLQTGR